MDVRLLGWIGLRDRHSWWWAAPRNVSRQRSDMDHAGLPICAKRGRFSSHRRVMTDKQKILIGLSLLGLGILFFMKRREISDLASAALDSANDELFRLSLPSSAQPYASIIKRVSSETGMDPFILAAIGERESRWGNALHPRGPAGTGDNGRSEEHTSELQSPDHLVCRLLLVKNQALMPNPKTGTVSLDIARAAKALTGR